MPPRIIGKPTSVQRAGAPAAVSTPPRPPTIPSAPRSAPTPAKKSGGFDLDKIKQIEADRKARRAGAAAVKTAAVEKAQAYADAGIVGDYVFLEMIDDWKARHPLVVAPHHSDKAERLTVCVRKRPLNSKEIERQEHDCLTCANPFAVIHECKVAVDGGKFLNNLAFQFDHVYGEESTTEDLYRTSIRPLVDFMVGTTGGYATVFAYGQTGSGKTYTMGQAQAMAVKDLFALLAKKPAAARPGVFVACFEIYGPKCQDLLNNRERIELLEDSKGNVEIMGLAKVPCSSAEELDGLVNEAMALRTTSKTDANDTSSRSHSIIQIFLHPPGDDTAAQPLVGMLSVVDLAGSERGQDTKSHNRQLRTEGAEINKSLLALKECIRAMTKADAHVSFRASKLTQVLKASFTSPKAMTVMVAAVSPAAWSADHTINTLRYADRVKEKAGGAKLTLPVDVAKAKEGGRALDMDDLEQPHQDDDEDEVVDGGEDDGEAEGGAEGEGEEQYEEAVSELNEAEEQLLAAHIGAVEQNASMCITEGSLLASVLDKSVVDYDIDAYADQLEEILLQRLSITNELQRRLADFRAKSRKEETVSRRMSWAKPKKMLAYEP